MAIDTVLVAVGPGDTARTEELAQAAVDVARPSGAEVILAHVFTEEEFRTAIERLNFDPDAGVDPDEVAARHATIKSIGDRLDIVDVDYSVRGAVGEHATAIVTLAEGANAGRVLVGGRSRSPTGKAVFGSTAQQVMLSAPCPVTFVRGD